MSVRRLQSAFLAMLVLELAMLVAIVVLVQGAAP